MNTIQLVPKAITLNQVQLNYNVISVDATKQVVNIYYELLSDAKKVVERGNKSLPLTALAALNTPNDIAAINAVLAPFGIEAATPAPAPATPAAAPATPAPAASATPAEPAATPAATAPAANS